MSLASLNPRVGKKKIYNARVFNASDSAELQSYVEVMRKYAEYLVQSPPNLFFSSKDAEIHIFIDWMSDYTYEEEFLQTAPIPPPADPSQRTGDAPGSALAKLAARLQAKNIPSPEPEPSEDVEPSTDAAGDPDQP